MMEYVRNERKQAQFPRISVELERVRPFPWLEQLIPFADVIFMSKEFALHKGG